MRNKWNKKLACPMAILMLVLASVAHAAEGRERVWALELTPDEGTHRAGALAFEEALVFQGSEVIGEAFAPLGFSPGKLLHLPQGAFVVEMDSRHKGKLIWSGTLEEGTMKGVLLWVRADGTEWRFHYKGIATNRERIS